MVRCAHDAYVRRARELHQENANSAYRHLGLLCGSPSGVWFRLRGIPGNEANSRYVEFWERYHMSMFSTRMAGAVAIVSPILLAWSTSGSRAAAANAALRIRSMAPLRRDLMSILTAPALFIAIKEI
jgi:hypothetical protein